MVISMMLMKRKAVIKIGNDKLRVMNEKLEAKRKGGRAVTGCRQEARRRGRRGKENEMS
jgi:hypothetical protein